ncbi:MAG: hypothetical protein FWF49_05775, partial [Oscillospiraceae bacterium]|nr:hypothetical protein [Oscillospiraceae bacterium]
MRRRLIVALVVLCMLLCAPLSGCSTLAGFADALLSNAISAYNDSGTSSPDGSAASSATPTGTGVTDPALLTSLSPLPTQDYYGYVYLGTVDTRLQQAYTAIAKGVEELDASVSLTGCELSESELQLVYHCYFDDYPQHFYIQSYYGYTYDSDGRIVEVQLRYMTDSERPDETQIGQWQRDMKQAATAVLRAMPTGLSDYDKELWIHDWVAKNVVYDDSLQKPWIHTLYGSLVNHVAVCDGYSRAVQYLLYQAGVQCLMGMGSAGDVGHAWNIVRVDGAYYQLDVTWDGTAGDGISYAFFNLTTDEILRDHTFDTGEYPPPDCTATADNYYIKNNWTVTSLDNAQIAAVIASEANAGRTNDFTFRILGTIPTDREYNN